MYSHTITLFVLGVAAVLAAPAPGYSSSGGFGYHHGPEFVHTVHHHHVKKVGYPVYHVEKVPVPVPVPVHHVEKIPIRVPYPVHHVEKIPVPVYHIQKVHVPVHHVEKVPVPVHHVQQVPVAVQVPVHGHVHAVPFHAQKWW